MIGVFKNSSSSPSEQMIHHVRGAFGPDGILTRLKSFTTHYPLQNWRGDVVVSFRSSDLLPDHSRFTPYGIPYVIRAVDFDNDGDYDDDDDTFYTDTRDLGPYDVRCDFDLNGRVDSSDDTLYLEAVGINLFGRGELSNEGNVFGYAGYVHDGVFFEKQHVRNRVLDGELGRWKRRDPSGYVDGMSLYEYVGTAPLSGSATSDRGLQLCRIFDEGDTLRDCQLQSDPNSDCDGLCRDQRDQEEADPDPNQPPGYKHLGVFRCFDKTCCICDTFIDEELPPDTHLCGRFYAKTCVQQHELEHLAQCLAGNDDDSACREVDAYERDLDCLTDDGQQDVWCDTENGCDDWLPQWQETSRRWIDWFRQECKGGKGAREFLQDPKAPNAVFSPF